MGSYNLKNMCAKKFGKVLMSEGLVKLAYREVIKRPRMGPVLRTEIRVKNYKEVLTDS